jgi:hypothetical protein
MKSSFNMALIFIRFLFRSTNFRSNFGFWISDCGLRIADLLYRYALSIFLKLTECLESKIPNFLGIKDKWRNNGDSYDFML